MKIGFIGIGTMG